MAKKKSKIKSKKAKACWVHLKWQWLKDKALNLWGLLKDHGSCLDLWKGLWLIGSAALLFLTGSLECVLGFLLLGWGILELVEHFSWH